MLDLAVKLVEPTRVLIIVVIALTLANAGWFFYAGPAATRLSELARPTAARLTPVSIDRIANLNLFGEPSASAPGALDLEDIPPDTTLNLELVGVFQANEPAESIAIIATKGKPAQPYKIGDTVPGNVKLVEVYVDRVVISRAGTYETLRFDDDPPLVADEATVGVSEPDRATQPLVQSRPPQSQRGSDPTSVREFVDAYRDQLDKDPDQALSAIGMQAVSASEAKGYRVGKLADSPYLSQTGLQPGDVIVSVNGRPVGDVRQDRLELDNIMAQGSARLEVQRGTRRFFVTASLK